MIQKIIFVLFIVIQPIVVCAQESYIKLLAGLSKPPFVMAEEGKGMQVDIIEAAFAKSNKFVRFTYLPINRHLDVFHNREFDGIITLDSHEKEWGIYLSQPYIIYQNVVVTLIDSKIKPDNINELADFKVAAFQNATRFLGESYKAVFKHSANYTELADQQSQISLLFSGRVDAVIMDVNIFKHLLAIKRQEETNTGIYNKAYEVHFLFNPRAYTAGFKSKELSQQFDLGIKAIMADGSYQQIIDSYLQ